MCLTLINYSFTWMVKLNGLLGRPYGIKKIYMKKTLSVFGALMLISSVVLAGGTPSPSESSKMAILKSGAIVKVFYKNPEAGKVKVTIYDKDDKALFTEEVKSRTGFVRPYNLNSLPEGDYRLVMQDGNEVREENVCTRNDHAKPLVGIIKANENQFVVTVFSKAQNNFRITVLDEERNVLFTELYSVNGRASKLFNVKDVKGAVSVEVGNKDEIIKSATL